MFGVWRHRRSWRGREGVAVPKISSSGATVQSGFSRAACLWAACALGVVPVLADVAVTPPSAVKLMADSPAAAERARAAGAAVLRDYGAFVLLRAGPEAQRALAGDPEITARPDLDRYTLRRGVIRTDATANPAPLPLHGERRLVLVQAPGPATAELLPALDALGARVISEVPANGLLLWAPDAQVRAGLEALRGGLLQDVRTFTAPLALAPELDDALADQTPIDVTFQLVRGLNHDGEPDALAAVLAAAQSVIEPPHPGDRGRVTNVTVRLPGTALAGLLDFDRVVNVEPYRAPTQNSERQAQVLAGNLNPGGTGAGAPGYLAWLATRGVPTTPASFPVLTVVDGGLDIGTTSPIDPSLYQFGSTSNPSRILFVGNTTTDPTGDDAAGHGHTNASIAGGYDVGLGLFDLAAGAPAPGYLRGLGVNPYARLGHWKIFRNTRVFDLSGAQQSDAVLADQYVTAGAQLSTNSWGTSLNSQYTARAQTYDALVRDASFTLSGPQPFLFIFANGNAGPAPQSVATPASAKNVLSIGATEGDDADGLDGCGVDPSNADNVQQVAFFSARGPVRDGRTKPDLVAPGTHISGTASRSPAYIGIGVCDAYWPLGQGFYARSSGTSHSTPAVAGLATLAWEFLGRTYGVANPSPALIKAYLMAGGRYLNATGGSLPSHDQGWGMADTDHALSTRAPRYLLDQTVVLDQAGHTFTLTGTIAELSEPVRIMLSWTDVPGTPIAHGALVNDLHLTVVHNGQTYRGNVFAGATSTTGGTADILNNNEGVFLPAGSSGPITVTITAANIRADGVPGSGDLTDQDFALVAYNLAADPAVLTSGPAPSVSDPLGQGNGNNNAQADPGEDTLALTIPVRNLGSGLAADVLGTLTALTPGVTVATNTAAYPSIPVNGSASNTTPFVIALDQSVPCGSRLDFRFDLSASHGGGSFFFSLVAGAAIASGPDQTFAYTGPAIAIPDGEPDGVEIPFTLADVQGAITNARFRFDGPICSGAAGSTDVGLDHTFVADLVIELISPTGVNVLLSSQFGGQGNNFCGTQFDDAAIRPLAEAVSGLNPFTGSWRPAGALRDLIGQNANGVWRLRVRDLGLGDTGHVRFFSLILNTTTAPDCDPPTPPPDCPVDYDDDGVLNQEDLAGFLTAFLDESVPSGPTGTSVAPCPDAPAPYDTLGYAADFNRDCTFDQEDLAGFLTEYFAQSENPTTCTPG